MKKKALCCGVKGREESVKKLFKRMGTVNRERKYSMISKKH